MSANKYHPADSTEYLVVLNDESLNDPHPGANMTRVENNYLSRGSETHQFTFRAICVGLFVGTIVNFSNMYFGLQTGWVSMMSMPASLIGFAIFKALGDSLTLPFGPRENVLVQTVAVAVGSMPLSAGFVGVIPALEKLLREEEGGPIVLSMSKLILWSLGVAFFGVFLAVPLRRYFIIIEKLKFPSGTATALMISVLHGDVPKDEFDDWQEGRVQYITDTQAPPDSNSSWKYKIQMLCYAFGGSAVFTLLSYFFPVLRDLPIFGHSLARQWLWTFNPSPAYVGQGIIMGLETTSHMLIGAIVGWAVLSPLAKRKGWAPGQVQDWQSGSRGWIIWVSLAVMLADCVVSLAFIILQFFATFSKRLILDERQDVPRDEHQEDTPMLSDDYQEPQTHVAPETGHRIMDDDLSSDQDVTKKTVFGGLFLSGIFCMLVIQQVFEQVPFYATALALIFALLLSVMGMRALGQTDLNPVSGISKLTQLVFALIIPASNPAAIAINMIAGAISEAGAQQAGDIMQDLKTGHILCASPRVQFYGQIIGSTFGAILSAAVYKLYASVYPIPGTIFQVPTAYVWLDCSRLVYGDGVPTGAWGFAMTFGAIFTASTVLKMCIGHPTPFIPGGIAVAVGIYNVPSFTLSRAFGGVISWYAHRKFSSNGHTALVIVASGLILGEGIMSITNMGLASFGVPHW